MPFQHTKAFTKRLLLVSPQRCDDFVRALKLRKNEVVIEVFGGPGQLTRSLLSGGDAGVRVAAAKEWVQELYTDGGESRNGDAKDFPTWAEALKDVEEEEEGPRIAVGSEGNKPSLVVAIESSPMLIANGLGLDPDLLPKKDTTNGAVQRAVDMRLDAVEDAEDVDEDQTASQPAYRKAKISMGSYEDGLPPVPVEQSKYDPRLRLVPWNPVLFNTLSDALQHDLVAPHLPAFDPALSPSVEAAYRPFAADAPPITIVMTVPDSFLGNQIVSGLIQSVIGAAEGRGGYIWRYGRVRIALLCPQVHYDRITATHREECFGKLAAITQALYTLTPLPPFHHVPNVDRGSQRTEGQPIADYDGLTTAIQRSAAKKRFLNSYKHSFSDDLDGPDPSLHRTKTEYEDFYPLGPISSRQKSLARPLLLGVLLEPRIDSPITIANHDMWDYVLRRSFTRQTTWLEEVIVNIGFGAVNLLPKIASTDGTYKGDPVAGSTLVRDIPIEGWTRIVDVVQRWPFKPTNILYDPAIDDTRKGNKASV